MNPMRAELVVRPAETDDLDRLVEIHACAYPGAASTETRRRRYIDGAFGTLSCVRVAVRDGRVVAVGKLYPFALWIGGRSVTAFGIGGVGVAPEARGAGVGRGLLTALHDEIAACGGALSLLYPFREQFYAHLGYATTVPLITLQVAGPSLERAGSLQSRESPRASGAAALPYTTVAIEGAELPQVRELYARSLLRTSGRLSRSEARWVRVCTDEVRHFMGVTTAQGELEGYVMFEYRKVEGAPASCSRPLTSLVVSEFVAGGLSAERALFAALARQSDQVDRIEFVVPLGDPLPFALLDADGARFGTSSSSHDLGTISAGPMVRLTDLRRALRERGYLEDGELTLRCANDDGTQEVVRLSVRDGTAEVFDLEPNLASSPDIEVSRPVLGSILVGGIRPSDAERLGLLRAERRALGIAEDLFSGPRFHCLDPF